MSLQDELVGRWSSYAYGGYGSMEDESIIFLPDHTGWYAFDRGFLCERTTFLWSVGPDNLLTITRKRTAAIRYQRGTFEERPSGMPIMQILITISEEPVRWPGEARMPVLTFASRPFAGSTRFAQITADTTKIAFPRFSGEEENKISKP